MNRLLIAACLSLISIAASAAERTVGVGTFDRVRVNGAFDVRIATGKSPRATLSGDPRAMDLVDLRIDGTTLFVRWRNTDAASARAAGPVMVTLSAQTLQSVAILGAGRLTISGMRTARADVSVAGTGTIDVSGVDAEQINASVVGGGAITIAGRTRAARLSTNGPGGIDAAALVADDLVVRLDGPGQTLAQSRYVATISSTGLGRVVVSGNAKCTVRAPAGATIDCGQ
ncbi:GIN domain-containing protein [Sphingomonas sp.]|jgi:hypothetical protein|uniref:GIN domain-containing protein n=1 Tax=Sphingomonas sp. TaxID=28214 RepID=UPI002EDA7845